MGAIALLSILLLACQPEVQHIYVAVDGDDQGPGTEAAPFASIIRALEQAKAARSAGHPASILVRAGTYFLQEPLILTPEHSGTEQAPFQLTAVPGEAVILSGARRVEVSWEKAEGPLYRTTLGDSPEFEQLYINGQKKVRARYPNYDPAVRIYQGYAADAISPERISRWSRPETGVVHAIHSASWGGYHYRITGVDSLGTPVLEGGFQNNRQMGMHAAFRMVENIREELDAPGEWFFDRTTGVLLYYPDGDFDPNASVLEMPVLEHLLEIRGSEAEAVRHMEISGFTFQQTHSTYMLTSEPLLRSDWTIYRGGAVLIEGAEHVSLTNGHFRELAGNGVFVNGYNREVSIASSHFEQIGANGICFVGNPEAVRSPSFEYHEALAFEELDRTPGPKSNTYPANCRAFDNLIHDIGLIEKQVAGVQIAMASEITVSHNSIYNVPRAGINIGDGTWGGHLLEFNDVFNTVLETGDHGAFNSWGRDRFWHPNRQEMDRITALEPSLILLDAQKTTVIRNNRFRCDHGWDIDLDDGSSNYRLYQNLCLSGGIKFREGFYRTAENNIMINNSFHPHVWFPNSHDVFRRNIVTSWYKPIRVEEWGEEVDYNLLPDSAALAASRELGLDEHGAFGDPDFIDPANGDFRVSEQSPALPLGFENFPMDQFGVVAPGLRALAESPEIPLLFLEAFQKSDQQTFPFLGAVVKGISSREEQSAAGLKSVAGILVLKAPASAGEGLQSGDVILALNGLPTANMRQLMEAFNGEKWKQTLSLTIVRNQQEMVLKTNLLEVK